MSRVFAFALAQEVMPTPVSGYYDPGRQIWIDIPDTNGLWASTGSKTKTVTTTRSGTTSATTATTILPNGVDSQPDSRSDTDEDRDSDTDI